LNKRYGAKLKTNSKNGTTIVVESKDKKDD